MSTIGRAREEVDGTTIGDLRLVSRIRLIERMDADGFGLGIALPIYFPTGDDDTYNSDGAVRVEPRLILDWLDPTGHVTLTMNAGYYVRPRRSLHGVIIDDQFRWGFGLHAKIDVASYTFGALLAAQGTVGLPVSQGAGDINDDGVPVEIMAGLRLPLTKQVISQITYGQGVTSGVGAPAWRIGVAFTISLPDAEPDPYEPIDDAPPPVSGSASDWDKDGLADDVDACPKVAGPAERRGCPVIDSDADGLSDDVDACPKEHGSVDMKGCPSKDTDGDTIPDHLDRCPTIPEDLDGLQDMDGCPEKDADNDGIEDHLDECPLAAETVNGFQDHDGCPETRDQAVRIGKTRMMVSEAIHFKRGSAKILKRSFSVLDALAQAIRDNPWIAKVRIEGHTDNSGGAKANMKLSRERAEAVATYLVDLGIGRERVETAGYGQDQPLAPNDSPINQQQNRRVEIKILQTRGKRPEPLMIKPLQKGGGQ